ncbi:uncharacterized protein LY89DRAFT_453534 [Mollisia scopiformis]|uniref:Uncharacterized protein n=1 Tax=Mollisia scopiformis TaxID=149040 RepID=A0A194XKK0_MOLSC|nr:uncharacterized protein LY89DRAFT_453534 [Mollisia scopiformis]KUJ20740.1 hypothetical protein LY89DRAFT_453534 [Mollisia scopiformis]
MESSVEDFGPTVAEMVVSVATAVTAITVPSLQLNNSFVFEIRPALFQHSDMCEHKPTCQHCRDTFSSRDHLYSHLPHSAYRKTPKRAYTAFTTTHCIYTTKHLVILR